MSSGYQRKRKRIRSQFAEMEHWSIVLLKETEDLENDSSS